MKTAQHITTVASSFILFAEFAAYNQYPISVPNYAYAFVLLYIVLVTFNGLFSLRIGDYYTLTPHQSSASSLLQSAKILTSLTPAAMFNFLKVCHIQSS
jgi:LMBR1-like membrane protein